MSHRTIHLFRKGLRLHDNPTLLGALACSASLFPVYVLDCAFLEGAMCLGALRWRFILQSLEDLDTRLRALGSRLYVLHGATAAVLRDLVTRWGVTQISYDTEVEPYYARMEREIQALAQERGLQTFTRASHTLYEVKRIVKANGGSPPLTYKKFLHVLGEAEKPVRDLSAEDFLRCAPPAEPDHEQAYRVPSLADLGLEVEFEVLWPGGETHALQRLHKHFQSQGWVANFSKPRTVPNSLLPSTTGLSPYLSLGCLSVRTFYHRIFCPVRFGRRTDPQGQYLRKYLPVLKNFPSQYIYEPWKAPEDVQLSAGCIIGKDYPRPMVCHIEASQRNLGMMRHVRTEQQNTAELTRDVADDPMEAGLKRELQEEEPLEGAEQHGRSKRFNGDADHKSRPRSWTPETLQLSGGEIIENITSALYYINYFNM
uniref:Cryptochrome circadian regulator 4 n=1 Tax=Sinocyclocheilus rhinocerous TaxID=307959 RepID=A0A673I308_9TELE